VATRSVRPSRAPIAGRFSVPPSKSVQQRALVLAVLADGESDIRAAGEPSHDVVLLASALSALAGRDVPASGRVGGAWTEQGLGGHRRPLTLRLGANATGFRASMALGALRPEGATTLLTGDRRLLERPHGALARALRALGVPVKRRRSGSYRVVARRARRREVGLDASGSSQPATALLLAAPRLGGLTLSLEGEPASRAYLRLTLDALAAFGVRAETDGRRVAVPAGAPRAARMDVESDASSAAAWWAAAALTGGEACVAGLPASTSQPDAALLPVLERMGARVDRTAAGEALVRGPGGRLRGAGDVDLRATPDLAPLVAALAAGAEGETRVVNAPHLVAKESDRVATAVAAVTALGGDAVPASDGFLVRGRPLRGGTVRASGDHRVAIAFGVLGLAVEGVAIEGAEAASKSWPGFFEALDRAATGSP
jgi:3-phosphoshikimate 1-carboxyvinyltransferase